MLGFVACCGLRRQCDFLHGFRLIRFMFVFRSVFLGGFLRGLLFRHGIREQVARSIVCDHVMLHQRNRRQISIIRLVGTDGSKRLTLGKLHEINTIGDVARVEQCGRLAGTQVENIIDRHIHRIRLLRHLVGHCVGEQVGDRSRRMALSLRHCLCDVSFEGDAHVTELQRHRCGRQLEILIRRQTHQLAIVGHHERTIGRLEITHGSIALRIN